MVRRLLDSLDVGVTTFSGRYLTDNRDIQYYFGYTIADVARLLVFAAAGVKGCSASLAGACWVVCTDEGIESTVWYAGDG